MFSICTGMPYSFLTAVPYENASSVYFGNWAATVLLGNNGTTRPFAASWPVQSWAATTTSGASADDTVPRFVSMSPKFLVTTWIVAPFFAAQALATLVMEAARFASVQMTIVGPALWDASADVAATAPIAATTPSSAHMRLSELCIRNLPFLSWGWSYDTGRLGAGTCGKCRALSVGLAMSQVGHPEGLRRLTNRPFRSLPLRLPAPLPSGPWRSPARSFCRPRFQARARARFSTDWPRRSLRRSRSPFRWSLPTRAAPRSPTSTATPSSTSPAASAA